MHPQNCSFSTANLCWKRKCLPGVKKVCLKASLASSCQPSPTNPLHSGEDRGVTVPAQMCRLSLLPPIFLPLKTETGKAVLMNAEPGRNSSYIYSYGQSWRLWHGGNVNNNIFVPIFTLILVISVIWDSSWCTRCQLNSSWWLIWLMITAVVKRGSPPVGGAEDVRFHADRPINSARSF